MTNVFNSNYVDYVGMQGTNEIAIYHTSHYPRTSRGIAATQK